MTSFCYIEQFHLEVQTSQRIEGQIDQIEEYIKQLDPISLVLYRWHCYLYSLEFVLVTNAGPVRMARVPQL